MQKLKKGVITTITSIPKKKWTVIFHRFKTKPTEICMGVGVETKIKGGVYVEYICNSILPETDKEYNKQHLEIVRNMKLIAAAPDLLEALQNIENDSNTIPETIWKMRNDAIEKATK